MFHKENKNLKKKRKLTNTTFAKNRIKVKSSVIKIKTKLIYYKNKNMSVCNADFISMVAAS